MKFTYDDGGRAAAGYKGNTGDCVCRAIAIASQLPYQYVYDLLNGMGATEHTSKNRLSKSSARTGVYKQTRSKLLIEMGWTWTPTMLIGSGCKVHLRSDELPSGRLIVSVSRHMVAVVDGVAHDTYDPSRGGSRCVYGYWRKA